MEEGVTDSEPESDLVPDHPPDAVQDAAPVDDQVRVEELPGGIVEGEAEREREAAVTLRLDGGVVSVLLGFAFAYSNTS